MLKRNCFSLLFFSTLFKHWNKLRMTCSAHIAKEYTHWIYFTSASSLSTSYCSTYNMKIFECCASELHGGWKNWKILKRKGKCYDVFIVYVYVVCLSRKGDLMSPLYALPCILYHCVMIIAQSHFIFRFPNDITLK